MRQPSSYALFLLHFLTPMVCYQAMLLYYIALLYHLFVHQSDGTPALRNKIRML